MRYHKIITILLLIILSHSVFSQQVTKKVKNYILINIDENSGLSVDDKVPIYRLENYKDIEIGTVVIVKYNLGKCAAKIVKEKPFYSIDVGDYIKLGKDLSNDLEMLLEEPRDGSFDDTNSYYFEDENTKEKYDNSYSNDYENWDYDWDSGSPQEKTNNQYSQYSWDDEYNWQDPYGYSDKSPMSYTIGSQTSLNLNKLYLSSDYKTTFAPGFKINANMLLNYNNNFKFGFAFGCVNKRVKAEEENEWYADWLNVDRIETTASFKYITLSCPIILSNSNSGYQVIPYFFISPEMFIKLSASYKTTYYYADGTTDGYKDTGTDGLKSITWGVELGVGVEIPVDKYSLLMDVGYLIAIDNISKYSDKFKINSINISLGMSFPIEF